MARPHPPTPATSLMLDLPDPCLLAVLRGCADDPASLFSAARAHSRLHQAAVLALSRVAVQNRTQQQVDSLLLYLDTHGQHVSSISLGGDDPAWPAWGQKPCLSRLPSITALHSLQLCSMRLQLQPGGAFPGVLGAGSMPLMQLRLSECWLLDGSDGLAAALALLPGLQHLSVSRLYNNVGHNLRFPGAAIQQLQQLTYLELEHVGLEGPAGGPTGRQPPALQGLTALVDLQLRSSGDLYLRQGDWLSGCSRLTRLVLWAASYLVLNPAILCGQTQLQHLQVGRAYIHGGSAGVEQLLSELQTLQQLTHLSLPCSLSSTQKFPDVCNPLAPAAKLPALTASSRLQHLNIGGSTLPAGAWQHVFPAGRQLPQLTALKINLVDDPNGRFAAAPAGSLLLSCCPGLQSLNIMDLYCCAEQLSSLNGLSRLHTLLIGPPLSATGQGLETVGQLTSLRQLTMRAPLADADRPLLHLTALQHLTRLEFQQQLGWDWQELTWQDDGGGGEPVWRQVLQHHLTHSDPSVPLQARQSDAASTAALA